MAKKKSDASTIAILKPDKRNARKHNPRNIGLIADSMQEVGAARSIVIDEDDNILAGNGAVEAAAQAGITKLHVVDADGETIVAVRRKGLTKEQKIRLSLADNRATDLGGWDLEVLEELADEDMLEGMFYQSEIDAILSQESTLNSAEEEWKGMPEYEHQDKTAYRTIPVHFACENDVIDFAERIGQKITENTRFVWFPNIVIEKYADKRYKADES